MTTSSNRAAGPGPATVVGAGQGGLHLAIGLQKQGFDVTLLSDKTPAEMLAGPAGASHGLHRRSMLFEEEAGVDCYQHIVRHHTSGIEMRVSLDGKDVVSHFTSLYAEPMRAIDTRFKFALLTELFERRGGNVRYGNATIADLEELADQGPVFVATGKGELGAAFQTDESRSMWDTPQRHLMLLLIEGLRFDDPQKFSMIEFTASPGRGEMFYSPNLHMTNRAISTVLFEAIPGSDVDLMMDVKTPEDAIRVTKELIAKFCSWENDTFADVRIADPKAFLRGAVRPQVRRPVATLPSGKPVFGIGDVVIVNDPVAGQGGNCTAYAVWDLLNGIADLEGRPITAEWFQDRFDTFWEERGQYFTGLTNMLLAPTDAAGMVLGAAGTSPAVASRVVDAFREPWNFLPHVASVETAQALLAEAAQEEAVPA